MYPIPNVGYSRLAAHRMLLGDTIRTEAFGTAIAETVRPGDLVVDLGSGTGILAMMAARAGASKVYAIEREQIVHSARRIARDNGLDDRIEFLACDVDSLPMLPEPADVLISECVGSGLVNTGMIESVIGARRLLRPGGRVLPAVGRVNICAVELPAQDWYIRFWERPQFGFDFRALRQSALYQAYTTIVEPDDVVSTSECVCRVDFAHSSPNAADFNSEVSVTCLRSGIVHGLCVWFELELGTASALSCGPHDNLTSWYHMFLPVLEPIEVSSTMALTARVSAKRIDDRTRWQWSIGCGESGAQMFDSDLSYPMAPGLPVHLQFIARGGRTDM